MRLPELMALIVACAALVGAETSTERAHIAMTAVQATHQGFEKKDIDPALEDFREVLRQIERFDTFRLVRRATAAAAYNAESRIPIDDTYCLCVTPRSKVDDGRVKLEARVEMKAEREDEEPRDALRIRCMIAPGRKLLLRGLKRDEGELIVVLSLAE